MGNSILHKAETRGDADHGWLHSRHTFSFADYYDPIGSISECCVYWMMITWQPEKDSVLILTIHGNYSIPLEGDLEHKDSMGNVSVIKQGDIQVMSAGTGITHSEYNKNKDRPVKFLQIWVIPNLRNVKPRYDQITLNRSDRHNKLQQILSPDPDDAGVWIYQKHGFI